MPKRRIISQLRLICRLLLLPQVISKPLFVADLKEDQRYFEGLLEEASR